MNKSPLYNQQSKSEVEEICIYQNMESISENKNSGFHTRKNSNQQYLHKVVMFSDWSFIQQKTHLCLWPYSPDITHWIDNPAHEKVLNIRQKLGLFVLRGHSHIESSHSLSLIDASGWVGPDLTYHEISFFVKILFNFKKKILAWIKANLKTLYFNMNLNWLHHVVLKF